MPPACDVLIIVSLEPCPMADSLAAQARSVGLSATITRRHANDDFRSLVVIDAPIPFVTAQPTLQLTSSGDGRWTGSTKVHEVSEPLDSDGFLWTGGPEGAFATLLHQLAPPSADSERAAPQPQMESDPSKTARYSLCERLQHIGALAAAATAILALLAVIVGYAVGLFSSDTKPLVFRYIATPSVVTPRYAFPEDNATANGSGLLAFGAQIEVSCRLDTPGQQHRSWVQLVDGQWLPDDVVAPAVGEDTALDRLPECKH